MEYDHGGDTGVLIDKYDNMINTNFHRNYTAGITGFIDEDETAITELTYLSLWTLQNESPKEEFTSTWQNDWLLPNVKHFLLLVEDL